MSDEKKKKNDEKTWSEEIEVTGNELVGRVKELIQQGNVRRLIIRTKDGETLMEVPLTASVVAGSAMLVFTPLFAAIGALVAFIAEVRLEVVRVIEDEEDEPTPPASKGGKTRIDIE